MRDDLDMRSYVGPPGQLLAAAEQGEREKRGEKDKSSSTAPVQFEGGSQTRSSPQWTGRNNKRLSEEASLIPHINRSKLPTSVMALGGGGWGVARDGNNMPPSSIQRGLRMAVDAHLGTVTAHTSSQADPTQRQEAVANGCVVLVFGLLDFHTQ